MLYEYTSRHEFEEVRLCVPTSVPFEVKKHVLPGYAIECDGKKHFRPRWLRPIRNERTPEGWFYYYTPEGNTVCFTSQEEAQAYLDGVLTLRTTLGPVEINSVIHDIVQVYAQRGLEQYGGYYNPSQRGFCKVAGRVYLVQREDSTSAYTVEKEVMD